MNVDKKIERERYNLRSRCLSLNFDYKNANIDFIAHIPKYLRAPYVKYVDLIREYISKDSNVLELGCGTGEYTGYLLETGASVFASDISDESLIVLKNKYAIYTNLYIVACDMEKLPFRENEFDVITCAGSLSYGDHNIVCEQISKLLKPNGLFICVDVFNNNPIYVFNRFIHFCLRNRSWSVFLRAPSNETLNIYKSKFEVKIYYYGCLIWLAPLVKLILKDDLTDKFLNWIDDLIGTTMSAFKIVFVAKNK